MKYTDFQIILEKCKDEYVRSKEKYPDFQSIKQGWKSVKREYCEVKNEILRDELRHESLELELIQLANVSLQLAALIMKNKGA